MKRLVEVAIGDDGCLRPDVGKGCFGCYEEIWAADWESDLCPWCERIRPPPVHAHPALRTAPRDQERALNTPMQVNIPRTAFIQIADAYRRMELRP